MLNHEFISTPTTGGVATNSAVLDSAHIGDIKGALGTIRLGDDGPRKKLRSKLRTLMAIVGPGLIVMTGDNDAGAFGTYTQAGQNYGTTLLWTLLFLIPVLYVNQEMVLRLGAVTGVGHARLILERFGKFWGAFSVIDLFVLNALTIVTEFIGIHLGLAYLGLPAVPGVIVAAVFVIAAASTGSFRRFERICLVLIVGSFTLIPILLMSHPKVSTITHDFLIPNFPKGASLSTVMLLIIAIVGTTVAPWQLFFQQSYVVDKRITPRYMRYGKVDLWMGIVIVIVGAAGMMIFSTSTFAGQAEFGKFTDAGGIAVGLGQYVSHTAGILFAIALIDASFIGAAAVGLSTSYAVADVLGVRHSLHRKPSEAKAFYVIFALLIGAAAAIVLVPGSPLGLLTEGVQTLAGVLLPSAAVFLLLLCNDKEVVGPWINSRKTNIFTSGVISLLIMLSIILTASVLYPSIGAGNIVAILIGGSAATTIIGLVVLIRHRKPVTQVTMSRTEKLAWRMPPLVTLTKPVISYSRRVWLGVLRGYLLVATILVIIRVVQLIYSK
jgi:NRAMP (natural resistance-associated macrophage protein)-like metal ion transporter